MLGTVEAGQAATAQDSGVRDLDGPDVEQEWAEARQEMAGTKPGSPLACHVEQTGISELKHYVRMLLAVLDRFLFRWCQVMPS